MPLALDETLDDIISSLPDPAKLPSSPPAALAQLLRSGGGVAALVVKPGVVGGIAASLQIARWGWAHGLQVRGLDLAVAGCQSGSQ